MHPQAGRVGRATGMTSSTRARVLLRAPLPLPPLPLFLKDPASSNHEWWTSSAIYRGVSRADFGRYAWQAVNIVNGASLGSALIKAGVIAELVEDALAGVNASSMNVRIPPHVFARINFAEFDACPIRRQFIPLASEMLEDPPSAVLDSLAESATSPVPGLVHRYPSKVLFLATSICPLYCSFCTRSYAVGGSTPATTKLSKFQPHPRAWGPMLDYIENTPSIEDVVLSGGDALMISPDSLRYLADKFSALPHLRRVRLATKGLVASPMRIAAVEDPWTAALIYMARRFSESRIAFAMHTHINTVTEITDFTAAASAALRAAGITVRNQSVLLRGVNDNVDALSALFRTLGDLEIAPYYLYLCDDVPGQSVRRTSLRASLELERALRGSIAGFLMPQFIVDLPGGGGKRLIGSYDSYDEATGVSVWSSPAVDDHARTGRRSYTIVDPPAIL